MCLELMRKIYQSIFLPKKFRNVNKSINKKGESEVTEKEAMEQVDELIKKLAEHIEERISAEVVSDHEVAEKTIALAELVSARAKMR